MLNEAVATPQADVGPDIKGAPRILVMDDEVRIRHLLDSMLEALGYETALVEEGRRAAQVYVDAMHEHQRFSAVLLDLTVPGGCGGKETARLIRTADPNAKLIVLSGYADEHLKVNAAALGFDAVLDKPVTIPQLKETLENILAV